MKNLAYVFVVYILISSCDRVDLKNPKSIVTKYYTSLYKNKFKECYSLLADTCKNILTFQDYKDYYLPLDSSDCRLKMIEQLPIDAKRLNYRIFKINYIRISGDKKDTLDDSWYCTTIKEKNKWGIIWVNNILKSAKMLQESENYYDAIAAFKIAKDYDPYSLRSMIGLTDCNMLLKNNDKAEKYSNELIKVYPEYYYGYKTLGFIYSDYVNPKLSIENYKKALTLPMSKDEKIDILLNLSDVYQVNRFFKEAIEKANEAINLNPQNTYAWCVKSVIFENQGIQDSVIYCLKKAINLEPLEKSAQSNVYLSLAKALLEKSKHILKEKTNLRLEARKYIALAYQCDSTHNEVIQLAKELKSI